MLRRLFRLICLMGIFLIGILPLHAADLNDFSVLSESDRGTYNEYRHYMVKAFMQLDQQFTLNYSIDTHLLEKLLDYAKKGKNYLPDNLENDMYFQDLETSIKRGLQEPNSEVNFINISESLAGYVLDVNIETIQGSIKATPSEGNAPLIVTFESAGVVDPSGSNPPGPNYIWWISKGGQKMVIGRGKTLNYTFEEEGSYTVFLDVRSDHRNSLGNIDVLPLKAKTIVNAKTKLASMIVNVNGVNLGQAGEIKFTPEEAAYGLIFDATSSTPTGGAKFVKTTWDFGNGIVKSYDREPRIERIVYNGQQDYSVVLTLETNKGEKIEKKFKIVINKPIATIQVGKDTGFIGDKFTFKARLNNNKVKATYTWDVIDISQDKVIYTKTADTFNHIFTNKGEYNIQLRVKDEIGNEDIDTKIIYINSRPPVADFTITIPDKAHPNTILLDGSKSFDLDFTDQGKLQYVWYIDGERVELDKPSENKSIGYFTFKSIGEKKIDLEVTDPDGLDNKKQKTINITSLLAVDIEVLPKVTQRGKKVKMSADAPNAMYFEWDFGDGERDNGTSKEVSHIYEKSGVYTVKLTVKDEQGKSNQNSHFVYISDSDNPFAVIDVSYGGSEIPSYDPLECKNGAYVVNKVQSVYFDGGGSVNTDGRNGGLSYTWKIGNEKTLTDRKVSHRFDELGCFPIKLTVRSDSTGKTHVMDTYVKVENLKPTLSSLNITVQNEEADPVIVNVQAQGAKDPDGVIQSYLWYYYTEEDNDSQDFRITSKPETNFVLPKIPGTYYFVVVLRDDNDARFSSDEGENKYSITLGGDNINTPLITFKANKNNVMAGEEVSFNVNVQNILKQDITGDSEFAWDFDGDGFYDKTTDSGTITHTYKSSGTFFAKVRVKHRGMTNVRTIEINVSNVLDADFSYINNGNEFIFFNQSTGSYDTIVWDMGDGNTITDRENFVYSYEDGKNTHQVQLKLIEGTKSKTKNKEVSVNLKQTMEIRNYDGIYVGSPHAIVDDIITLDVPQEYVLLYVVPKNNTSYYSIDYDIQIDTDLNGQDDDDIDNISDSSYTNGGFIKIPINSNKEQGVRLFTGDENKILIHTRDIVIEKLYIVETPVDDEVEIPEYLTEEEKNQLEKLKSYLKELPQLYRLEAMQMFEQLVAEWGYVNERTRIILDFEEYIDSLDIANKQVIIELLESLLGTGSDVTDIRDLAYLVVKNLLPPDIDEYSEIIRNLDYIYENPEDVITNKSFASEILEIIKESPLMNDEDKYTVRTQLLILIGDDTPPPLPPEVPGECSGGFAKIGCLFQGIGKLIVFIVVGVIVLLVGVFLWFKITNKNKNQGLQDFIIDKASGGTDGGDDPLGDFDMGTTSTDTSSSKKQSPKDTIDTKTTNETSGGTPSWLSGGDDTNTSDSVSTQETSSDFDEFNQPTTPKNTDSILEEDDKVDTDDTGGIPSWLQSDENAPKQEQSVSEDIQTSPTNDAGIDELFTPTPQAEVDKKVDTPQIDEPIETKIEEEEVPDWLKGAISEEKLQASKTGDLQKDKEEIVSKTDTPETPTSSSDDEMPSWLQASSDPSTDTLPDVKKEDIQQENTTSSKDTITPPMQTPNVDTPKASPSQEEKTGDTGLGDISPSTLEKSDTANISQPPQKKKERPTQAPQEVGEKTPTPPIEDTPSQPDNDLPDWLQPTPPSSQTSAKNSSQKQPSITSDQIKAPSDEVQKQNDVMDWLQGIPGESNDNTSISDDAKDDDGNDFWSLDEAKK